MFLFFVGKTLVIKVTS